MSLKIFDKIGTQLSIYINVSGITSDKNVSQTPNMSVDLLIGNKYLISSSFGSK